MSYEPSNAESVVHGFRLNKQLDDILVMERRTVDESSVQPK